VILSLVKSGAGVALLPLSMVHHEIESGTLKRVLQDWTGQPRQIFLIWAYQRTQSVRAKRFQDELLAFLAEQSWFSPERD
jgi:LysR family transcriptional regulator AphB